MRLASIQTSLFLIALLTAFPVLAQVSEERLFGSVEDLRNRTEAASAALLAPSSYSAGVKALERARLAFTEERDLGRIQSLVEEASGYFEDALEATRLARVSFEAPLKSRDAANAAEAFRLAPGDWTSAEQSFGKAARTLEKGDLASAREVAARANEEYQLAELNAIKALHLGTARAAIVEASEAQVERYAPRSISRARELLGRAESSLSRDRYDVKEPAELAEQSAYEARHALFIASVGERVKRREATLEDILLEWEAALRPLALAARAAEDFSAGPGPVSASVQKELERIPGLEKELEEMNRRAAGLEDEIRDLDEQLRGSNTERTGLIRRLQAEARVREQFDSVENLFTPAEATVLRDGDNLILRLVGLRFGSGSAKLGDEAIALLDKVHDAINTFPRSELLVEGHTDTSGSADTNLRLSQQRAEAVAEFLINSRGVQAFRIKSTGYGDSRPVANNSSAEGRAMNRRIDIVIQPRMDDPG